MANALGVSKAEVLDDEGLRPTRNANLVVAVARRDELHKAKKTRRATVINTGHTHVRSRNIFRTTQRRRHRNNDNSRVVHTYRIVHNQSSPDISIFKSVFTPTPCNEKSARKTLPKQNVQLSFANLKTSTPRTSIRSDISCD